MRVYCLQHDIAWENPPANCARVAELLKQSHPLPGSLVLLPEMFSTGFTMNINAARAADVEAFLAKSAGDLGVFLQAGVTLPGPDGKGLNVSLTFSPAGRCVARYAKLHPFSFGTESKYYSAGNALVLFDWSGIQVAPFICYDLRFPEIFRAAALRGALFMTVIANWPVDRAAHWRALLIARAIENQAYVAAVNRVGTDPKLAYAGGSLLIDPRGNILADAGAAETVISAELDIEALHVYRRNFPALLDIRPDMRAALQKFPE